jgi:hypothetical protein
LKVLILFDNVPISKSGGKNMGYFIAAEKELANMLVTHQKITRGREDSEREFNLASLLSVLGHNAKDWSNLSLDDIYQAWAHHYEQIGHAPEAAAKKAHLTAAHRAGSLLKMLLKRNHKEQYEVVGRKESGRYGGPIYYRWLP